MVAKLIQVQDDTIVKVDPYKKFQNQLDDLHNKFKKESDKVDLSTSFNIFLEILSTQIIHRSRKLFSRVPSQAYLNQDDNFIGLKDYYNQLSLFVSASILEQDNRSKRVFSYELWVRCINKCIKSGDYTGAFSIYSGLNFYYMDKYIKKDKLSSESKEILSNFKLISDDMLHSGKSLDLQQQLLTIATQQKTSMIPQIPGLMPSFERAKQVWNDTNDELNRIIADKTKVEDEMRVLLESIQELSPNDPELAILKQQRDELECTYKQLESEYEEIEKEYDGQIPECLNDDKNIRQLQGFLNNCKKQNEHGSSREILKAAHHYSKEFYSFKELLFKTKRFDEDKIEEFAKENCNKRTSKKISKKISRAVSHELNINPAEMKPVKHITEERRTSVHKVGFFDYQKNTSDMKSIDQMIDGQVYEQHQNNIKGRAIS